MTNMHYLLSAAGSATEGGTVMDSIISFAFPMAVGIVSGFYSSVLLSSPLWAWWRTRKLGQDK